MFFTFANQIASVKGQVFFDTSNFLSVTAVRSEVFGRVSRAVTRNKLVLNALPCTQMPMTCGRHSSDGYYGLSRVT